MNGKENWANEAAVIYCNCCYEMGKRFRKLGQKYAELGDQITAARLEEEAVVQLDAWRRARQELKDAM